MSGSTIFNLKKFDFEPIKPSYSLGQIFSTWKKNKNRLDGIPENLWRIDNALYDLTEFKAKHPGGKWWIDETRGLDITELVQSHHLNMPKIASIMAKYKVADCDRPRNSFLCISKDGFYNTLKNRIAKKVKCLNRSAKIKSIQRDILVAKTSLVAIVLVALALFALATVNRSVPLLFLSAFLLGFFGNTGAHNYLHRSDKFLLRYIWDLCGLSMHGFRFVHTISHHHYSNSMLDLEMTTFEPIVQFNSGKKTANIKFLSYFRYNLAAFSSFIKNLVLSIGKDHRINDFWFLCHISLAFFTTWHSVLNGRDHRYKLTGSPYPFLQFL